MIFQRVGNVLCIFDPKKVRVSEWGQKLPRHIYYCKESGLFEVKLKRKQKHIYLGKFKSLEQAAARLEAWHLEAR